MPADTPMHPDPPVDPTVVIGWVILLAFNLAVWGLVVWWITGMF